MVFAANASSWTDSPARASSMDAATDSSSWVNAWATHRSPTQTALSWTRAVVPSTRSVITSLPAESRSGIPAATMISGPRLG